MAQIAVSGIRQKIETNENRYLQTLLLLRWSRGMVECPGRAVVVKRITNLEQFRVTSEKGL